MHFTGRRPDTRRGPAENFTGIPWRARGLGAGPRTFMTHLAVVEAAGDGTTTEWHAHVADHPA